MPEESILQNKILRDLDSMGKKCIAFKIRRSSVNGAPDIFFAHVVTGPVLLETKAETDGKLSPIQIQMHKNLSECRCKVYSANSWSRWVEIKKSLGI